MDAADVNRAQLAEVLGTLAHELRSPVSALRHQAQLLAADDLPADMRRRSTSLIEQNASALEELVERLDAVRRALSGEPDLR